MLGYASLIPAFMCMFLYFVGLLLSVQGRSRLDSILVATFFYFFMIGGMAVFSIINFWRFPNIRVGENGLDILVGFYKRHIRWEVIKTVRKEKNGLFIFLKGKV
jgi:hypothetical protein